MLAHSASASGCVLQAGPIAAAPTLPTHGHECCTAQRVRHGVVAGTRQEAGAQRPQLVLARVVLKRLPATQLQAGVEDHSSVSCVEVWERHLLQ